MKLAVEQRQEAADRLGRLLENISEPVLTLVDGERISYANLAAQRLFGQTHDGLAGKDLGQVVPELGGTTFRQAFREVAGGGPETTIDARIKSTSDGGGGKFNVRVFPNSDGIGLFFQRQSIIGD